MSTQIIMDNDSPRARLTDPVTSHAAADSTAHLLAESSAEVLFLLQSCGPLADHELVKFHTRDFGFIGTAPQFSPQRLRTARHELTETGHVMDTGIYRLTPSGRRAKVWGVPE